MVGAFIASFFTSLVRVCYLKYKNQLRNRHETLLFQIFMIILTAICALSAVFTYMYDRQCPWVLDWERFINVLDAARILLQTIIKAFIVFMSLSTIYGFNIILTEITPNILKSVFSLTIVKFFLYQAERSLSGIQALITFMIVVDLMFITVMLAFLIVYFLRNLMILKHSEERLER